MNERLVDFQVWLLDHCDLGSLDVPGGLDVSAFRMLETLRQSLARRTDELQLNEVETKFPVVYYARCSASSKAGRRVSWSTG